MTGTVVEKIVMWIIAPDDGSLPFARLQQQAVSEAQARGDLQPDDLLGLRVEYELAAPLERPTLVGRVKQIGAER